MAIEYRFAQDRVERVPELVADLIRRRVNVICTSNNVTTLAVKKATSEIPLVFVIGLDPVAYGSCFNHQPAGRQCHRRVFPYYLTGAEAVGTHAGAAATSRGQLPRLSILTIQMPRDHIRDLQAAAGTFGLQLLVLKLREVADFEPAFATLVQQKIGAVLVISDSLFHSNRLRLVDLAARNTIPTMYPWRDFATPAVC